MGTVPRGSKRTHFRFASTFVTAAFITAAARSHSLRDNAVVTAIRMLGRTSTSSCSQRRRARVIHTPCASTSPTMSCNTRSSPAISNDGGSRGAGVDGFGAFRVTADDCAEERRWRWTIGEAACEGIVIVSTRSSTARIARTFSCRALSIDGVFRRMLMSSETETSRRAGRRRKRMRCR